MMLYYSDSQFNEIINLALWYFEPKMCVINMKWLKWPKTSGTSAAWRSTMTMSSSSLESVTKGQHNATRDNKWKDREKGKESRKKDIDRMKGRHMGRDGNRNVLATSGKLLPSSLRHNLFILISTQRRRQLKRYLSILSLTIFHKDPQRKRRHRN